MKHKVDYSVAMPAYAGKVEVQAVALVRLGLAAQADKIAQAHGWTGVVRSNFLSRVRALENQRLHAVYNRVKPL